jgi:NAD(P)-dependent dehydrogenase (short-subunit alcohol dehydrogenase family)
VSTSGSFSTPYAATKGAILAFTKNLAQEVAGSNITVNALALSGVLTPKFKEHLKTLPNADKINMLKDIPLARIGEYEDYISSLLFIIDNKFLTGQIISPNGGQYI